MSGDIITAPNPAGIKEPSLPPWLIKLVTTREVTKQRLGTLEYYSQTGPFKRHYQLVMKEEKKSALRAMIDLLIMLQDKDPTEAQILEHCLAISAGLDMAEEEDKTFWEEKLDEMPEGWEV